MKRFTINSKRNFHNITPINVIPKKVEVDDNTGQTVLVVSRKTYHKIKRRLCPFGDCTCQPMSDLVGLRPFVANIAVEEDV